MADNKKNKNTEKKQPSKEVAKSGDDVFNVVKLISKADPPKGEISNKTKDGR
jgi:hypothetical protein